MATPIPGALSQMTEEETDLESALSEALIKKTGANINGLISGLSTETTNRTNADSAEASARVAGDATVDNRISAMNVVPRIANVSTDKGTFSLPGFPGGVGIVHSAMVVSGIFKVAVLGWDGVTMYYNEFNTGVAAHDGKKLASYFDRNDGLIHWTVFEEYTV